MPLHIIHLEDSSDDALLISAALVHGGVDADIRLAQSRQEFDGALGAGPADLIITDSSVAGFSGRDALEEVRRRTPGTPVLVVSGHVDESEARRTLEAGAADVISKSETWRIPFAVRRAVGQPLPPPPAAAEDAWPRLVGVIQKLSLARDLDTITAIVRRAARELTGADGASFVLRDGEQCYYADEDAIAPLWKGKRFPMSACISGWVMLNRRPAVIEDIYADPRIPADAYRPTFVKSLAMVPIRTESPIGAIGNYWAARRTPTPGELAVLGALADSTSLAIENVQLYQQLDARVRDRTRELESANRELEAFSYTVSHDLRAPVRAIRAFSQLLREKTAGKLEPQADDMLTRIEAAGARMHALIDGLLALAKLGRSALSRRPVDLSALAHETVGHLRQAAPERSVAVNIAPGLVADADPVLLRAVMENLLSNAWKYTAARSDARIDVGLDPGPPAAFFVRDNGAGFDAARATGLFTPFCRFHRDTEFPGIGIGLTTVQRIVERHGGRVWADSAPGQGATFRFTLPKPEAPAVLPPPARN